MSDINKTITESIEKAFNAGKEFGKLEERQRLLKLNQVDLYHQQTQKLHRLQTTPK